MGKRDDKDNKTALDLINLIKDLVTDELNKRDNTCVCQVVACNEDGTYNIFVVPDTRTVITNVKSMSLEVIKVGDYVYVYKFQNKLNNAIILARAGTNAADIRFVTVDNFNSTITTRSSGGGGKVDDVLVNNTSVVGEDKVARIDLTSYVLESELADVAFSGDYADLLNTPLSSISISQDVQTGTASRPETTTTTITIDGVPVEIKSYTKIDSALSSSSKNPVANNVIYNAISNKVDAEDFQELEQIALTTRGILTGEPLTPVLAITDGVYYPTVSDSGKRWKMGKADSPTFFKIYDVSNYTSVHLKSVSRAGHILTDTAPSDFNTKVHQNPTQVSTWYEAASVSDSEQADVLPKTGYTPYDKDLTTNGKHYLIVYEVNAAQAIEVIYGGGYSPITTSMFVNDGDGTSPYARLSDLPAAQVNADWNASSGVAEILNKPTLGTAASKDTGTSAGNVPVLDSNGKLVDSVIPAVAITDTYEAASEAAMLALNAQKGDVCIRSDLNKTFILSQTPASTLANWKELKTPTDAVLSVNGQTGAVQLDASDVGALPDTTTYIKNASVSGNSLTLTKQDNTTVVYDPTFTDNDHYPTSFSWTNGTTSGPTGSLSGNSGFTTINFPAIPAASNTQSGIVTTGSQNFKGEKNFPDGIKTSVLKLYDGYNDDYAQVQSGDDTLEFTPSGGDSTFSMTDDGHFTMANSNGQIDINMKPTSGGNVNVNMPSSSGTIALLEETQVEIVDLTQLN